MEGRGGGNATCIVVFSTWFREPRWECVAFSFFVGEL